jgi:hypothetical protein
MAERKDLTCHIVDMSGQIVILQLGIGWFIFLPIEFF